jgi:ATP-dependent DNA helicase RecG
MHKRIEDSSTEFKREYTDNIKKTITAFANTNGGTLYIGVADDGSVAGLADPDEAMLKVSNVVKNAILPDLSLFIQYEVEYMEGVPVIKVRVHKGTARPYYLAGKGIRPEGVYLRQGAATVPASESVIVQMIKETDGEKYEAARSLNQDLTFTETAHFFEQKGVAFGINQQKSLHFKNTEGIFTNLGLLFSDQAVHTVKLAVFEGLEKDIFRDRQEFSGSLLKQLTNSYDFLDRYNQTHAEVKGLYRVDHRDYPEDALREALLNALVHRDYGFSSSILISIFANRIEFVSIGGLPGGVSLEDLALGISVPRNENLANVFYRLKLIEAYGTGIPRIFRGYAACPAQPVLQATGNAFKITLPNRNAEALTMRENQPPVYAYSFVGEPAQPYRYGGAYASAAYTENEEQVMALLQKQPVIIRKDVEAALGVSQAMAVRVLRGLLDKGAIRSRGGGKKTRYVAR